MAKIDDLQMLRLAVEQLPEKYRKVLALYYQQDFNFREIAELLKESLDTVKTRHRRAIIHLKKMMAEE